MDTEFWKERWGKDETGFHLDKPNPALVNHWHTMPVDLGTRVLVPLCGKSVDIIWFLKEGYQVVGAELSEKALDALAYDIEGEFGLAVDKQEVDGLILYRAAGILLICGDWFALTARDIGPVDAVYDRAALVALPPQMRVDYSQHLLNISRNAPQLLVSFAYDQNQMPGPPFSVPEDEVIAHYGSLMHADVLDDRELIDLEPRFRERGVTSMRQAVYRLTPR